MPAVQTYRNIQDRIMELLSKSDPTTRNRVKNWVNMGYSDFVLRELWPFRETTGTLALVSGTQEYDLSTNFSDLDEQNITSVAIQGATNKKLPYRSFAQLRASEPDLDLDASSVPQLYYLKAGQIGFWPKPDAAYSVAIDYFKLPTEMVGDDAEPILPLHYRESLVHYGISMEHDYNTDPDLAQKSMNRYEQILHSARVNLLSQPVDTEAFRVLGPADSRNHTRLSGEVL